MGEAQLFSRGVQGFQQGQDRTEARAGRRKAEERADRQEIRFDRQLALQEEAGEQQTATAELARLNATAPSDQYERIGPRLPEIQRGRGSARDLMGPAPPGVTSSRTTSESRLGPEPTQYRLTSRRVPLSDVTSERQAHEAGQQAELGAARTRLLGAQTGYYERGPGRGAGSDQRRHAFEAQLRDLRAQQAALSEQWPVPEDLAVQLEEIQRQTRIVEDAYYRDFGVPPPLERAGRSEGDLDALIDQIANEAMERYADTPPDEGDMTLSDYVGGGADQRLAPAAPEQYPTSQSSFFAPRRVPGRNPGDTGRGGR